MNSVRQGALGGNPKEGSNLSDWTLAEGEVEWDAGRLRWQTLGRMEYDPALELQENLVGQRLAEDCPDTLLLLEHPDIFTIGRRRDQSSLGNVASLPYPVRQISRGGQATWHGPGQLVGYPILDLTRRGRDLHRYLRALESVVIELAALCGVKADRSPGQTGVWVDGRKLASIGVGVRRWISCHGFALNVNPSMDGFSAIVPCGIDQVVMTSLQRETTNGDELSCDWLARQVPEVFAEVMQRELPCQG